MRYNLDKGLLLRQGKKCGINYKFEVKNEILVTYKFQIQTYVRKE